MSLNSSIETRRCISASGDAAHTVMPRVHRVAALLDRWWLGTHQGAISPKHLDYYLDEYTFRFNRRRSRAPGMLFYRLLEQNMHCLITCSKCRATFPMPKLGTRMHCPHCGHVGRILGKADRIEGSPTRHRSDTWIVVGIVAAVVFLVSLVSNNDSDSTTPTPSTNRRYDPNSTSETDRQMIRDKMIEQGADTTEAEAFTRELYKLEREHRRNSP